MKWEQGRQGEGYEKLKLFESRRFKFDVYLMRFWPCSEIQGHRDPAVEGYEHHRLNIVLQDHNAVFWTEENGKRKWWWNRIHRFRPDTTLHGMQPFVSYGKPVGYWLSIGWLRKKSRG